jgi:hypothetical protein
MKKRAFAFFLIVLASFAAFGCTGGPIEDGKVVTDSGQQRQKMVRLSISLPKGIFPKGASDTRWSVYTDTGGVNREDLELKLDESVQVPSSSRHTFYGLRYTLNSVRYTTMHYHQGIDFELKNSSSYQFKVPEKDHRMAFVPESVLQEKKFYSCQTLRYGDGQKAFGTGSPHRVKLLPQKDDRWNRYTLFDGYLVGEPNQLVGEYELVKASSSLSQRPLSSLLGYYKPFEEDGVRGLRARTLRSQELRKDKQGSFRNYFVFEEVCFDVKLEGTGEAKAFLRKTRVANLDTPWLKAMVNRYFGNGQKPDSQASDYYIIASPEKAIDVKEFLK